LRLKILDGGWQRLLNFCRREEAGGAKFAGVRHGMFHVAGAFSRVDNFRTRTGQPPDFFRQRIDRNGLAGRP
jgi:hypothetical protein